MEKAIIAAIADNLAIGKDNSLLWHISDDLKYFKKTTSGYPVIMGRKTFESIGRPLPGRLNIVVSRHFAKDGVITASSLQEAFEIAEKQEDTGKCFVMGGGEIYRQAIDAADSLYITHVQTSPDGADTFFPAIDPEIWETESMSETYSDPGSGLRYRFAVYRRKKDRM